MQPRPFAEGIPSGMVVEFREMKKENYNDPIEVIEMPSFNDRQIYNNNNNATTFPIDPHAATPGYALRQNVRTSKSRKKTKTSNVVAMLFLIAAISLFYVGNVIAVNNLAREVNDLHAQYNQIISTNEVIKAEINHKASLERISLMAQEKLGMTNPKEAPTWFEVDQEKEIEVLEKLEQ